MVYSRSFERSIIKLGNSMAITFPQEWFQNSDLQEHSKVFVLPIDDDTLIIQKNNYLDSDSILHLDLTKWPSELSEQLILTAFKLNVDKLFVKYNLKKNKQDYLVMINKLQRKIIGFDYSISSDNNGINIRFLLDSTKTTLPEILIELYSTLKEFIIGVLDNSMVIDQGIYQEKFDRKYHLGIRLLLGTLLKYPKLEGSINRPIIRTLGDRITLLYSKELMNYALKLKNVPKEILDKYSLILIDFSDLILSIIEKYNNNIKEVLLISFQKKIDKLKKSLDTIDLEIKQEENMIRNIISRFFSICTDLIEISITRILEAKL
ncbi:MAG: hypothetical protein ACFFC3_10155 [Candidatus Odinarchaeota archaeon]